MKKVILIRYSEIHLKGNNKHFFEKFLFNNIKQALCGIDCDIAFTHTRYLISNFNESDLNLIISKLMTVFGIHSFSVADEIDTSVENGTRYYYYVIPQISGVKAKTNVASGMYLEAPVIEKLFNN